jgi:uncharacterized protein (TIGR03437 family)
MKRIANALGKLSWGNRAYAVLVLCITTVIALPAETLTVLHSFDGTDGANPGASVAQGTDGNFYGTAEAGGANGQGTVFKITPDGTFTTLYSFCSQGGVNCTDGASPQAGLVQNSDGDLYGTTYYGGANGAGTVFKITFSGTLTTLYSFCSQGGVNCTDGECPVAGLALATNGDLYGTTTRGGAFCVDADGCGTVFKITPNGELTTLYAFSSQQCTDGVYPNAGLVQGNDGNFYGTTFEGGAEGGANGAGTVFKITPSGALTTLHSFAGLDGNGSDAGLVQASNGDFYGTTYYGGANAGGNVFRITPSGTLTTLYSFCSQGGVHCTDGKAPYAGLVQASDGDFYGTTTGGGIGTYGGTVFKITPSGTLTTLYSFCLQNECADGQEPYGLIQATNGDIYGTTEEGGANSHGTCCGTVFSLSVGLGPSVPAVNAGGVLNSASYTTQGVAPGSIVSIFGTNLAASTAAASAIPLPTALSDVTSVTFNGIAAGLYFVSQNQINAQLPFNVLPSGQDSGMATIVVTRSSGTSAPQNVNVAPASPGIFTTTANGLGQAFAYDNTTGALAAPGGAAIGGFTTAPISVSSGHALIVACTGLGSVTPSIDNYVAASDGILRNTLLQPTVLIGGVQAQFVYSVLSPQFVSEYQIGVVPAPGTPTGDAVSLQIRIGGVTTTAQVTIAVAP